MTLTKVGRAAAITAAAGALVIGGAALAANAATTVTPSPGTSTTAPGTEGGKGGPMGGHSHTPVTGDELAKVSAAVKAKDSAVTVASVMKDEDGSYDVFGTKAGNRIGFEVSKDLKTVTERQGGRGGKGGPMGGPGHNHTPVTGDELTKVTAAVKAKDSAVTVTSVMKDEDGSYDVFATKAGAPIGFEVSKDLKTVTERQGPPGGRGGRGGPIGHDHTPVTGDELAKVSAAVKAEDSAVTVASVMKDEDGSYDVFGTKAGNRIGFEVSKDLGTVTERTRPAGGRGPGAPAGQAPSGGTQGSTSTPTSTIA